MTMFNRLFFTLLFIGSISTVLHAQRGKQGNATFTQSSPGPNYIVNEYTSLSSDASSGASVLSVANAGLNSNNRFPSALNAGDLIFIVQMQGAQITTPDDSTYGAVSNYNGAGNNEWAEVKSVDIANNTISLVCGLQKSYLASGHTQIIRVPRFNSLTIQSNAKVTCPAWNGTIGGVVVIETNNALTIQTNGSIDVSSMGFRGGATGTTATLFGGVNFLSTNDMVGAEKGEGIAGSATDYDAIGGRFCRGAAANAGGGGNAHNSGGGGGGNGGSPSAWNGKGNPSLTTANWAQAWNLEYAGFANSTSSGGGKGGYSFSSNNLNALNNGTFLSTWGGDWRRNNGGLGGRPLDHSNGALFLGGGGGGGEQNNNYGGPGGNGGGMIVVRSFGAVSGSGKFLANGANGTSASGGTFASGTDGSGGGGAGGTIVVQAVQTIANLTMEAKGGNGGSQDNLPLVNEAEGPGGGGGGGYIALSNTITSATVAGGANGTTDANSMTEFIPNGATKGGNGEVVSLSTLIDFKASSDTLCGPGLANLNAINDNGSTLVWSNTIGGTSLATTINFQPSISGVDTFYVSACPLAQTAVAIVSLSPTPTVDAGADLLLCAGQTAQLNGSGSGTLVWNADTTLSDINSANPTIQPLDSTAYILSVTDASGCSASDTVIVNVGGELQITLSADTSICAGTSLQLHVAGAETYIWQTNPDLDATVADAPIVTPSSSQTFYINASTNGGCSTSDSVHVEVYPAQALSLTGGGLFCDANGVQLQASNLNAITWSPTTGLSDVNALQPMANPSDSTWYHASGIDANGCAVTTSDSVLAAPGINPIAAYTFIQTDNYHVSFTNTSSNAMSCLWTIDGSTFTSTDVIYNFPFDNTYTIKLIVSNACGSDTLISTINVVKFVGIEEVNLNQLKLYPNPVSTLLSVTNPFEQGKEIRYNVIDAQGKLVESSISAQAQINLDFSKYSAGLYLIQAIHKNSVFQARIVHP
ncbi:MAG: hypothetical protein RLZZ543_2258 [Bacteroidota bacterium]